MKKIISIILIAALSLAALAGCAKSGTAASAGSKKIVVGASPTPHAIILKEAAKLLKQKGYDLEVKEFNDYVLPNTALVSKELDANYFQHVTYLDDYNKKNGTDIVSAGSIHYEPFGIYAGKTKSLADLKDGATISVPNDTSNEARALLLLQAQGLIKLKDDAGITATQKDIVENKKNLKFTEIEAAQLVRSLPDVDLAVINGNYALQGSLKVSDAIAVEKDDSIAAEKYANVLAIRKGDENREEIKALVEVLKSDEMKTFIKNTFNGAVVPVK
ncbi:ABC transporter substrate-binding protein [Caproiciproducens galactitolivorans]|uniref:Lipoprotein n=1 Tax=Caproiciproducens galactitolivorans TaxID=642589 RepID=A0A4Z0Y6X6_9FIRM|nr:MetQ/NlpA family ABC transporter substrate-binding protein [Caproiciproducens galactitolivorans]QEY33783.1 ABC transporter substrate-binding protein [Caproiciproducens galactitolivorans]TGJ75638.1 methionine-binding lipoprotein MetQ precursor [Caproiciproducens galactitolivorans]